MAPAPAVEQQLDRANGPGQQAALPSVASTVAITFFLGLFGLIPAISNSRKDREAGGDGSRYWKAFGWAMAASTALYVAAIGGIVLVLAATVATVTANSPSGSEPTAAATASPGSNQNAVLLAARKAAVDMTGIDYRTLDQLVPRVTPDLTPGYLHTFMEASNQSKASWVADKVVETSTVTDAALESLSDDRATVLVTLDSSVAVGSKAPSSRVLIFRVLMQKQTDGSWLVSNVSMTP
jgi:hypothetical protein